MDGRDTGDRIVLKRPTISEGADEFVVDIDWAAAHAGDDFVFFEVRAAHADENHVLFRKRILQHAGDFHFEAFRLRPLEHRETITFHARA